jgi:hypothetical protein
MKLLFCMHLASHSLLLFFLLQGIIGFEPIILLYSLFAGILSILSFTHSLDIESSERRTRRLFIVDGESSSIVGLRMVSSLII